MVNEVSMNYMRDIAKACVDIVNNVYIPDVKAIASMYRIGSRSAAASAPRTSFATATSPKSPTNGATRA